MTSWRVGSLLLQLGLALALARAFHIESPMFYLRILPLAVGGALINHLLPLRHRPSFFAALGIYGILLVFGYGPGGWMVVLGLILIGLCHLPIPFRFRLVVIGLAGVTLMLMRAGWIKTPWPGVIWPIFASMFMFRLGLYLYDLKHYGPMRPDLVLSYFFLLPNVVFLLFPVLDFHTYRRTYYDRKPLDIYEEGAQWILRGLTHLVLYRLIYTYVAMSPAEVISTTTLVRYLLGNYGLYLRVSGQFHMIVGLLHLFGFRLPETHRFFYLASSFSDMWRRMNIYWKDFMQKTVFLPVVFGLKRQGETVALLAATATVALVTWFGHSYQWFWLVGAWLFSATDMVFWGTLGMFMMANSLWELRRGRVRQLSARAETASHTWGEAAQTAGMFGFMCVLWGLWTSPTFGDFRALLRALTLRPVDLTTVATPLVVVAVAAWVTRRLSLGTPSVLAVRRWWQHPLLNAALPLGLLWAVGEPALASRISPGVQEVARQARTIELNKYDAERLQRGYYERVAGVNRFNGELWEVYARAEKTTESKLGADEAPADSRRRDLGVVKLRMDPLGRELNPNVRTIGPKGEIVSTNRWGMRDRDYAKAAAPETRRIAVLGSSYVMGSGVSDGETFEALIEDQLNRQWSQGTGLHYELLNFGVPSYTLLQQDIILSNGRVGMFHPDVVMIIGNELDILGNIREDILKQVQRGASLSAPVAHWVREAGVRKDMADVEFRRRLTPYNVEITRWALGDMASQIDRIGAQAIYALVPTPSKSLGSEEETRLLLSIAEEAGFIVVDISDVFRSQDYEKLSLSAVDRHPNREGHRVIAARLYAELIKLRAVSARERQTERTKVRAAAFKAHPAPALAQDKEPVAEAMQERWSIETHEGSAATVEHSSTEPGRMRVSISSLPRRVPWHVKLREVGFQITGGDRYLLVFRGRSDAPRQMTCAMGQNVAPWNLLAPYRNVDLTPEWKTFECPFVATSTELNARIFFDLGQSDTAVELSDVALQHVSSGRVAPTSGPAAPVR